jgi:hypothetical protein
MARAKKSSQVMDDSNSLLNALEAIDPKLDLGNDLTLDALKVATVLVEEKLKAYNASLSVTDMKMQDFKDAEKVQKTLIARFKNGIKSKFGLESEEYATIGGIRPSERKPKRRKKTDGK